MGVAPRHGGGLGLLGDMVVGIAGAFIGTWIFRAAGHAPWRGLVGAIVVAFIGAALLRVAVRFARGGSTRRS